MMKVKIMRYATVVALLVLLSPVWASATKKASENNVSKVPSNVGAKATEQKTHTAIFAGGCFWCSESDFEKIEGVLDAESGYLNGHKENPTYPEVSAGTTGHIEAVRVKYNPNKVSYAQLLKAYWFSIDPLAKNAQFCDRGEQYRSAVFYKTDAAKQAIEASKKELLQAYPQLRGKIQTEILATSTFWPAEDYHQSYYTKNPIRYKYYRYRCGRDARLKQLWGDNAGWTPKAKTSTTKTYPSH